ncbi:hypothetical protein E2C01_034457 [Portunus trituberculatus]|uniref:Uncharacterized protein n=1 Tax=Portunus trituberculatus TaxID=210409 RepID=A0A5B7F732_PORTR|nr:hypothetical protein [Portunus trituberculatus]
MWISQLRLEDKCSVTSSFMERFSAVTCCSVSLYLPAVVSKAMPGGLARGNTSPPAAAHHPYDLQTNSLLGVMAPQTVLRRLLHRPKRRTGCRNKEKLYMVLESPAGRPGQHSSQIIPQ